MNTKYIMLTSVAVVSMLTLSAFAAENDVDRRDAPRPQTRLHSDRLGHLGKGDKASGVIGMTVKNAQNEKLGKVDELVVDLENGRIVEVIVSVGGLLGVGDKTVAVPPGAFTRDENDKALRLATDKEKLKSAPAFELSRWQEYSTRAHVAETYRYYGHEVYFSDAPEARPEVKDSKSPENSRLRKNGNIASTQFGQMERASKLTGMTVKNKQDEKVGKVDNLIVDLANGRIPHVLVSSGGFLGIGDELSVVPPTAFHYDAAQSVLHLDTTKEALMKAPHFKSSEWPNLDDPVYSAEVYRAYRVEPYFSARVESDNTARNVRDRQDSRLTPLDQGSSKADVETTRRIRQEILDREGLSVNARNVKVITVNGRVTLRGPVSSEAEKQGIADIANRIAQRENVDNQLEVKGQLTPAATDK